MKMMPMSYTKLSVQVKPCLKNKSLKSCSLIQNDSEWSNQWTFGVWHLQQTKEQYLQPVDHPDFPFFSHCSQSPHLSLSSCGGQGLLLNSPFK